MAFYGRKPLNNGRAAKKIATWVNKEGNGNGLKTWKEMNKDRCRLLLFIISETMYVDTRTIYIGHIQTQNKVPVHFHSVIFLCH